MFFGANSLNIFFTTVSGLHGYDSGCFRLHIISATSLSMIAGRCCYSMVAKKQLKLLRRSAIPTLPVPCFAPVDVDKMWRQLQL